MVFPTFFNLSLNLAIRSSWSEPQSAPGLVFADYIEISPSVHWKNWCWSWNYNTLATWCEELTHWKRPWCWEGLGAGGKGDNKGWDRWIASPTWWTWVWVNSGSWWWTGRPGVLQFMGSQRVGHNWVTELNWTYKENSIWLTADISAETLQARSEWKNIFKVLKGKNL